MTPAEIPWRALRITRGWIDAARRWPPARAESWREVWDGPDLREFLARAADCLPSPTAEKLRAWPPAWRTECLREADKLLGRRVSIFHSEWELGRPIDWSCDPSTGISCRMVPASTIDVRETDVVGDVKYTWELSRMQHLTRLAQAWRISGDDRYAEEVVLQIGEWIEANPWMRGINWVSPMECGLRLISWTWAIHYLREWDGLREEFLRLLAVSISQHLATIDRGYSLYSSANNHLVAEAAGAFIAASYWKHIRGAARIRTRAFDHLIAQSKSQATPDGVNIEHAFPYQVFVWELFYLPTTLACQEHLFPPAYLSNLLSMAEFLAWITDASGCVPNAGDEDGGVAIRLSSRESRDARHIFELAGRLSSRDDLAQYAGGPTEMAAWATGKSRWVLGTTSVERGSRTFHQGGYHVFRAGRGNREVVGIFDLAGNGDQVTGAHGHADALSIQLHLGGIPFLGDPGTYSYLNTPKRRYYRSTAAHSTLVYSNLEQSQYLNRFMWGRRADVSLLEAELGEFRELVRGRVQWWTSLWHERDVECIWQSQEIYVRDRFQPGEGAAINFIFPPWIEVSLQAGHCLAAGTAGRVLIASELPMSLETVPYSVRCYHEDAGRRLVLRPQRNAHSAVTRISWEW